MNEFCREVAAIAALAERALMACAKWLESVVTDAERAHHRGELLAAYRRRASWKKADVPRLQSLGVNAAARRRVPLLKGRGRPVVTACQPLWPTVAERLAALQPLISTDSSPQERRRALRLWPWWQHHVEALYRGEHELAKTKGVAGPSRYAEEVVGNALSISPATVHNICGAIRRKRREWDGAANFPPMTLREFDHWMNTGTWPDTQSASP